jgi:hypothetical protein
LRDDSAVDETDDLAAVAAFEAALSEPFTDQDLADGWSEQARDASITAMSKVTADLAAGWGDQADYASHHLVRALDHWGVLAFSHGRLHNLAEQAQEALIRLRAQRAK